MKLRAFLDEFFDGGNDGKAECDRRNDPKDVIENSCFNNNVPKAGTRRTEHNGKTFEHFIHIFEIEHYPTDQNGEKKVDVRDNGNFFEPFEKEKFFEDNKEAEPKTPENIVPACAVPKTGEEPYDKKVEVLVLSVAAEGNIDIVAEESAEGHMPATPEFRCTSGNIGVVEVFEEVETENSAEAYCHIGITGEVVIDLDSEHYYAEPNARRTLRRKIAFNKGIRKGTRNVCDENFFCKTDQKSCGTGIDIVKSFLAVVNLDCNVGIAYDWARNKLCIEGNVHKVFHIIVLGFNIAFINVNGIAQSLEGIEADTDWKSKSGYGQIKTGKGVEVFHKESAVFENSQKSQVENEGGNKGDFLSDFSAVFFYHQAVDIVNSRAEDKKGYPNRFSPCIEEKREHYQDRVPEGSVFCCEIKYQVKRQEHIKKEEVSKYHKTFSVLYFITVKILYSHNDIIVSYFTKFFNTLYIYLTNYS